MRARIVKRDEQTFPLLVGIKLKKNQTPEEQEIILVALDLNDKPYGVYITGPEAGRSYGNLDLNKEELYEIFSLGSEITLIQT